MYMSWDSKVFVGNFDFAATDNMVFVKVADTVSRFIVLRVVREAREFITQIPTIISYKFFIYFKDHKIQFKLQI